MKALKQFIGFCLVGGSNVIINWTIYYLFIFLVAKSPDNATDMQVQIATLLGFVISMFNGFLLNYYFVFKAKQESFWKALLRFATVYICTSYIVTAILTWIITKVNLFGVGVMIAPVICTIVNTPINFFFSKKWAFKKAE